MFTIDYIKDHPRVTRKEFTTIWNDLGEATKNVSPFSHIQSSMYSYTPQIYKQRANDTRKAVEARKVAAEATEVT